MDLLTPDQRQELLRVARRTLQLTLQTGKRPVIESESAALLQPAGAFVTLHRGEQLRGCIGTFEAGAPLLDTVQRMAVAAAQSDPRFAPVRAEELDELTLEISVLSPLRPARAEEVEVGVHGVFITRGANRGVLLPQVAVEHGWDRETFLQHTCLKARLPPEAWQEPGTRIEVFSAQVFGEDAPPQ